MRVTWTLWRTSSPNFSAYLSRWSPISPPVGKLEPGASKSSPGSPSHLAGVFSRSDS